MMNKEKHAQNLKATETKNYEFQIAATSHSCFNKFYSCSNHKWRCNSNRRIKNDDIRRKQIKEESFPRVLQGHCGGILFNLYFRFLWLTEHKPKPVYFGLRHSKFGNIFWHEKHH